MDAVRFIPARAGNTKVPAMIEYICAVHPRSRGEHAGPISCGGSYTGSSPLARGTHRRHPCRHRCRRFIPARAGNTHFSMAAIKLFSVHPRSRGEHASLVGFVALVLGSSPLARGTHLDHQSPALQHRFIPARAGNTTCWRAATTRRSRFIPARAGNTAGSRRSGPPHRFIPARAGNTLATSAENAAQSVHPRSRGEHPAAGLAEDGAGGSSPLARGTHLFFAARSRQWRFIHARAGNTSSRRSSWRSSAVHPRSRGEHIRRPASA